jgi:tetratricopeptide (TPR) repeat protein
VSRARGVFERPSVRAESHRDYRRGRALLRTFSRSSFEEAKSLFERAIALDPENAAAQAGLADATLSLGRFFTGSGVGDWRDASRALASRAIQLDPSLSEPHVSLARILVDRFEFAEAEDEYRRAVSLDPNNSAAHEHYALLLEAEGRVEDALREYSLAEGTNSLGDQGLKCFAGVLDWQGRFDEALVKIRKIGELNPDGEAFHQALFEYHRARFDLPRCMAEIDWFVANQSEPESDLIWLARREALNGHIPEARLVIRQVEASAELPRLQWGIALAEAELGDLDECYRHLNQMVADHNISFGRWRLDPRLAHVRSDPRFGGLLEKMNLPP